jgi:hypothetical protein
MFRRNAVVLTAISLLLVGAAAASATTYTVTNLGTYTGTPTGASGLPRNYLAMGQNANGGDTVAGILGSPVNTYYWQGANAQESSGTQLDVIKPAGYGSNTFNAISSNGALAAGRANGSSYYPFVYSIPGTTSSGTILTSYVGSPVTVVGVNNAGDMVTNQATNNYLLPSGTSYTVGTLPGATGGNAPVAMSDNGNVISLSSNTGDTAQLWTPIVSGGVITGYNNPTTFTNVNNGGSWGAAVNNAGEGCGVTDFTGLNVSIDMPCLFSGGKDYPISGTDTNEDGAALSINDKGVVVGWDNWDGLYGTGFGGHGFIWVPNVANGTTGTLEDMNTVFASVLTGTYAGYVITDGLQINDNGDVLVRMSNVAGGGGNSTGLIALISTPWAVTHNPGDANGDGRVDINDLTIVLAHYNQTGQTWSQGAMDGDPTGTVDINDLTIVLAHYGDTYAASAGLSAVPEPAALAMLLAGLLLAAAWRITRRCR